MDLQRAETMADNKPKMGRPKERPEGEKSFTARLPDRTYRLLKLLADANDVPVNKALTMAVEDWISRQPGHEDLRRVVDRTLSPAPTTKKGRA